MIRLPGEYRPYGILFVTAGTGSDMMVTGLTIAVGARVRYLLHRGAKARGVFYIIQRIKYGREIEGARYHRARS